MMILKILQLVVQGIPFKVKKKRNKHVLAYDLIKQKCTEYYWFVVVVVVVAIC
jgi:hypothetical protein